MSLDITPMVPLGRQVIQSYGYGGFVISDVRLDGPALVFPDRSLTWNVGAPEDLCLDDFAVITGAESPPEILLLGLGEAGVLLPALLAA
ncbi:MAG: Mth938-like domain-containing protein, partial [Pseudomonadota bacterium]|nr:Mth938-like domain-containing protein [Pseudomonadota bacterium]